MRPPEAIRHLPDSTPCYVPGVGEVTVGMVRRTEEKPALEEEWPATLRMYARKATDHYTAKGTVAGEWRWSVGRKGVNRVTVYGREKQSGTTGQALDRIYVQDDMPPKVRLAESLAQRLGGA